MHYSFQMIEYVGNTLFWAVSNYVSCAKIKVQYIYVQLFEAVKDSQTFSLCKELMRLWTEIQRLSDITLHTSRFIRKRTFFFRVRHKDAYKSLLAEEKKEKEAREIQPAEEDWSDVEDSGTSRGIYRKNRTLGISRRQRLVCRNCHTAIPQFRNITKFGIKSPMQLQADCIFVLWLAGAGIPYNVMEKRITREFFNYVFPEYNVKSGRTYLR